MVPILQKEQSKHDTQPRGFTLQQEVQSNLAVLRADTQNLVLHWEYYYG